MAIDAFTADLTLFGPQDAGGDHAIEAETLVTTAEVTEINDSLDNVELNVVVPENMMAGVGKVEFFCLRFRLSDLLRAHLEAISKASAENACRRVHDALRERERKKK